MQHLSICSEHTIGVTIDNIPNSPQWIVQNKICIYLRFKMLKKYFETRFRNFNREENLGFFLQLSFNRLLSEVSISILTIIYEKFVLSQTCGEISANEIYWVYFRFSNYFDKKYKFNAFYASFMKKNIIILTLKTLVKMRYWCIRQKKRFATTSAKTLCRAGR